MSAPERRAWAGSDDDVFRLLTSNNRVGAFTGVHPMLTRAYVAARGRGIDPVKPVFEAHFGTLYFVAGSPAHTHTVGMCARFDGAVAFLRSQGENLLGGAE